MSVVTQHWVYRFPISETTHGRSRSFDRSMMFTDFINKLNFESMPNVSQFHVPAKSGSLWKLPFMMSLQDFFSDEIQIVKDVFDGTDMELPRD